jgi:2-polyprenyl-3-methyl-5-hydroxy-6-metoxy-1,4-benzoquinol methylase
MIIHKLLYRHFFHRDDSVFYMMQAEDAISWLEKSGVALTSETEVLDLGCGHGVFGDAIRKRGCKVTFADTQNYLPSELKSCPYISINLDDDDYPPLGQYDLVVCSNVLEHLSKPENFIRQCAQFLKPGGRLYLSWTNWLSPFGGHDFIPLQYLGPRLGSWVYRKLAGKNNSYDNGALFVTYIGRTLKMIRNTAALKVCKMAARYYPEFSFVLQVPIAREFLAWNCALLISKS